MSWIAGRRGAVTVCETKLDVLGITEDSGPYSKQEPNPCGFGSCLLCGLRYGHVKRLGGRKRYGVLQQRGTTGKDLIGERPELMLGIDKAAVRADLCLVQVGPERHDPSLSRKVKIHSSALEKAKSIGIDLRFDALFKQLLHGLNIVAVDVLILNIHLTIFL